MKRRLCWVRVLALVFVGVVFLSPLSVRGALASTLPGEWDHSPSTLTLPSAPTYPAVMAYRDIRMSLAERSYEKAEVLLGFANDDAYDINTMAGREEYTHATSHCSSYRQNFDECIFWLVHAGERSNVTNLVARVKTEHVSQQFALAMAQESLPTGSAETVLSTRLHAAGMLVQALQVLEGDQAAVAYAEWIVAAHPELDDIMPDIANDPPPPDDPPAHDPPVGDPPAGDEPDPTAPPDDGGEPVPAPRIQTMTTDRTTLRPQEGSVVSITLEAGGTDDLRYTWWCALGTLEPGGAQATWIAPNRTGVYEIRVTVTDSAGRSDSRSVEIEVIRDEPPDPDDLDQTADPPGDVVAPEIISLRASADHKYFAQNLGGCAILVSRKAELHCQVADTTGLTYDWTISGGGKITGTGDTVTFTAPATRSSVTVTVTVTNEAGETDTRSLTFHVTTCQVCFV